MTLTTSGGVHGAKVARRGVTGSEDSEVSSLYKGDADDDEFKGLITTITTKPQVLLQQSTTCGGGRSSFGKMIVGIVFLSLVTILHLSISNLDLNGPNDINNDNISGNSSDGTVKEASRLPVRGDLNGSFVPSSGSSNSSSKQKEEMDSAWEMDGPFVPSSGSSNSSSNQTEEMGSAWEKIWENAALLPVGATLAEKGKKEGTDQFQLLLRDPVKLNVSLSLAAPRSNDFTVKELFDTFPPPVSADTIQIYNETAYKELIQIFMTKSEQEQINICANGGSVTAGGGTGREARYFVKLEQYIRELQLNAAGATINVIDRGHGTRHSLHSAVFAPNVLPHDADLLLWEFAVNDYGYNLPQNENSTIVEQERSIFIAWLREVEKLRKPGGGGRPPLVIVIYLWKSPFDYNGQHLIDNPIYDAHAQLAREFDFVVGHVNFAAYFDEFGMTDVNDLKRLFLADRHHPNSFGHLGITFLLLNLLRGKESDGRPRTPIVAQNQTKSVVEKYDCYCGTESSETRFVQSQVISKDESSGWRSPLGTATLESPRNDVIPPRSRQLIFDFAATTTSNNDGAQQILGKQDPARIDRQGSVSLACCRADASIISDYTTIRILDNAEPMHNVQSLFFGFGKDLLDVETLKVYINSNEANVNGRLIRVENEYFGCFWSWKDVYDPLWFAFSEIQPEISRINLCVTNKNCDEGNDGGILSKAMLISIAAY